MSTAHTATPDQIAAYVIAQYLSTGSHLFISDVAAHFDTSPAFVRKALDGFDFDKADRWTGSTFAGRYVQASCVEPSKEVLRAALAKAKGGAA